MSTIEATNAKKCDPGHTFGTSEQDLIARATQASSAANWVIGECASQWVELYGKGRTYADFADAIGTSRSRVGHCVAVWDVWHERREQYPDLKWSHFRTALNWDDAETCLQWAQECEATRSEMIAWRRASHNEDLTQPQAYEDDEDPISHEPRTPNHEPGVTARPARKEPDTEGEPGPGESSPGDSPAAVASAPLGARTVSRERSTPDRAPSPPRVVSINAANLATTDRAIAVAAVLREWGQALLDQRPKEPQIAYQRGGVIEIRFP